MKRNIMLFIAVFSFAVIMTGCGKSQTPAVDGEEQEGVLQTGNSVNEVTQAPEQTPAVTEAVPTETEEKKEITEAPVVTEATVEKKAANVVEGSWEAGEDIRQKFPVNFAAYRTDTDGLTVGMSGEIHYTTNSGTDWPKAENKSNCCFGLDFVGENIIYVCGNGEHVVKSTDGGKTFTRVANFGGSSPNQCKMLSFFDENNGVIASAKKMAVTSDGAATWTALTIPCEVAGICMASAEKIYYVGKDFNMYISEDKGATWNASPLNLPEGEDYYGTPQAFAFNVTENGYFMFTCQKSNKTLKCYETTDNAATWTEYTLPEVIGHNTLYLNDEGNVMTANNGLKMTAMKLTLKK